MTEFQLLWLMAILVIIVAFVFAIFARYFKYKERKLRHTERLSAIEKGLPIAAEFEEEKESKEEIKRDLLIGGIITLSAGIGIFSFLYFMMDLKVASVGIVPSAIGIGLLLSSVLIKEKKKKD